MKKLSRKERDLLWGDSGPYSQAQLIFEHRILDERPARTFVIVSLNINPFTFELVKKYRDAFADDLEIQGILDFSKLSDPGYGYNVYSFSEEYTDEHVVEIAKQRLEDSKLAIIRMHEFVMKHLGIEPDARNLIPRRNILNIKDVMSEFLSSKANEVSENVFSFYEDAVGFFEEYLDGYGYLFLEDEDANALEQAGEDAEFSSFFDPDILDSEFFLDFVGGFLPRKVLCGHDRLQRLCRAAIVLYEWLCERGYVSDFVLNETTKELRFAFEEGWKKCNK